MTWGEKKWKTNSETRKCEMFGKNWKINIGAKKQKIINKIINVVYIRFGGVGFFVWLVGFWFVVVVL